MSKQPYYETMYILRPTIPEDEVDSHLKKYTEILEGAGGEVLDSQMRGKRRLAYPIGKHKEGIYVQLSHKGNGEHIAVLEKAMRLTEDVIRFLTVKQYGPLPTKRAPKTDSKDHKNDNDNAAKTDSKADDTVKANVKDNAAKTDSKANDTAKANVKDNAAKSDQESKVDESTKEVKIKDSEGSKKE
ncbi:SSU ribosomal protein S6p [Prochlorococcus sp. MIT 0601]|nr:SSU ribosomal protein S6p [Prochlorococcus sp. MIT 0601]